MKPRNIVEQTVRSEFGGDQMEEVRLVTGPGVPDVAESLRRSVAGA